METFDLAMTVNNEAVQITVPVNRTLLQVLREDLDLMGTKYGCGTGECGSCTVLMNGKPLLACLTLAAVMHGKEITTVEGLEQDGALHPVQEAFVEENAVQCGFCTPGMIMKSAALLSENPNPTDGEIKQYLEGNICRCTGYVKIIDAVRSAGQKL